MAVGEETLARLQEKARLYDVAKDSMVASIKGNIGAAIKKLKAMEGELLEIVGIELGENPFANLLASIITGDLPAETKVQRILSVEIPQEYGPSEESFYALLKGIDSFKSCQRNAVEALAGSMAPAYEKVVEERWECVWKECPDNVDWRRKYNVNEENPSIVSKFDYGDCTAIGNASLPSNKVSMWNIKILKSKSDNSSGIYIGAAPLGINQNDNNSNKCGWYFNCYTSTLWSGPPHKFISKEYGPRKGKGEYVHTGDSVGVVMDTTKGELSFVLNGANLGVAYEGIPLDKPLVPCVILVYDCDSVELVI